MPQVGGGSIILDSAQISDGIIINADVSASAAIAASKLNLAAAVAVSDLANGTDGELITWGADAVATTIAAGTADQVLTSNGAGAAPTFQDASPASRAFIVPVGNHSADGFPYTGTRSSHPTATVDSAESVNFAFSVPADFVSLTKVSLVCSANTSYSDTIVISTAWGADDAAMNDTTDSLTTGTIGIGFATVEHVDISDAFTGIAAGDSIGVNVSPSQNGLEVMYLLVEYASA